MNRHWWRQYLAGLDLPVAVREELLLVLHEVMATVGRLDGEDGLVRVLLDGYQDGDEFGRKFSCEVLTGTACEALDQRRPAETRLTRLWLADLATPSVTVTVHPHQRGSRLRVQSVSPPVAPRR